MERGKGSPNLVSRISVPWGRSGGTSRRKLYTIGAVCLVGVVGATAAIVIWQTVSESSPSQPGVYGNAGISCDAPHCADIGKEMLERGGSVSDAAIATLLCMGIYASHSLGIGGGFLMVKYNASEAKSKFLNAREVAPKNATRDMYDGDASLSARGPLAVAVPGEIKGYWELHQESGLLPWKDLFQPTIDLCKNGFEVSYTLAYALRSHKTAIEKDANMAEIFVDPKTGEVFVEGDIMKRPTLAATLERVAAEGADVLYTGELAQWLVEDLQNMGGIMQMEDLANYRPVWKDPIVKQLRGNLTLHTAPPPGSGILLAFMLQVLDNHLPFIPDKGEIENTVITYQRIAETFKHTYAQRTKLGDPFDEEISAAIEDLVANMTSMDYVSAIRSKIDDASTHQDYEYYGAEYYQPENHGTAHLSIIAANGDAIGVTSTVNLYFGARIRSNRTGIIYNDEMDDFSAPNITNSYGVPPSPNNFIKPGKRPVSSMTPTIFTDEFGKVRLVVGGAGGTKITTGVAMVAMRNLWFGSSLQESVDSARLHHQLYPMELEYENISFSSEYVRGLEEIGHTVKVYGDISAIGAVSRQGNQIYASADFTRKNGSIAGY